MSSGRRRSLARLYVAMAIRAIALVGFGVGQAQATTLFEENFDGLFGLLQSAVDEAIDPSVLGWTHTPPAGWSIDNSNMGPVPGMTEWQGWSFATMDFWDGVAPGQERANFTLSSNVFAIADPDEWDDKNNASSSGSFNSVLISPGITVGAGLATYLYFDSHYRQWDTQTAQVRVSFDGGADQVLLHYDGNPASDNGGQDVQNEEIVLAIPAPATTSTMVIRWHLSDAGNDWYWAIDNVRVTDVGPPPPPPPPVPFLSAGPYVQFVEQGAVTIFWETDEPRDSIVEYGETDPPTRRIENAMPTTVHEMTITGIDHGIVYYYCIRATSGTTEVASEVFEFDSTFDYSPGRFPYAPCPYPEDGLSPLYAQAAERIVEETSTTDGFCLVLGCGEGRLAYEIAKRTNLKIVGIEEDGTKVATARRSLDEAGIYGDRVSVHHGSLSTLPYSDYFANLVVSDRMMVTGQVMGSAAEIFRVLRPCGGVAYLGQPAGAPGPINRAKLESWLAAGGITGVSITEDASGLWAKVTRAPLAGSGEWSHAYAEPGNSACSNDQLVQSPMKLLWFGRPGPRLIIDRHHRPMPSLVKDGRVFIPANNRIIAIDGYNGARLWDVSIPNSRRVGLLRDCGHVAATSDYLYVAVEDKCCGIDVLTGTPAFSIAAPQYMTGQQRYWGYLATVDNLLFGTGEKEGASRTGHSRDTVLDGIYWDYYPIATSDYMFCLDRHTGQEKWNYQGGVIINPAIAMSDDHVYFVESRNPAAALDSDGRVPLTVLLATGYGYLVKLNKATGTVARDQQVDLPFEHVIYLSYAQDTLLALGSRNVGGFPQYELRVFDAGDLSFKGGNSYQGPGGTNGEHGEQDQHPVIVGNTIYSRPYDFSLTDGTKGSLNLNRAGGGCGTLSASSSYLFGRGGNPQMYDLSNAGANIPLTYNTRPGCWINIIPAGGLILIPESSSGCTCSYPVQTSLAFVPE